MLFTRLHANDPHWKGSRKTLARAFSADEIRCGDVAAGVTCGDTQSLSIYRGFTPSQRHNLCSVCLSRSMLLGSAPLYLSPLADCTVGTVGSGLPALARHPGSMALSQTLSACRAAQEEVWRDGGRDARAGRAAGRAAARRDRGNSGRHETRDPGACSARTTHVLSSCERSC